MSAALQQPLPLENDADQGAPGDKKPKTRYPDKVSVRILDNDDDRELYDELNDAVLDDGITISDRLRALGELWKDDPVLQVRVRKVAKELAARKFEAANEARRDAARRQFGKT